MKPKRKRIYRYFCSSCKQTILRREPTQISMCATRGKTVALKPQGYYYITEAA